MATADNHCECNKYDLSLMTVNANGPNTVEATDRIDLLTYLWNEVEPDITVFQEFKWSNGVPLVNLPDTVKHIGNDESSIMIDDNNTGKLFKVDEVRHPTLPSSFMIDMHEEFLVKGSYLTGFNCRPFSRMIIRYVAIPRLDSRGQRLAFLLVSWYGSLPVQNKYNQFVDTCTFLAKVAKSVNLPFVVAGDFNIDSEQAEKMIAQHFLESRFEIKLYGKNVIDDRRKSSGVEHFIDYFLTGGVNTDNQCRVKLYKPRTLNIIHYNGGLIDVNDSHQYPLDHDPLMVYIKLCSCGIFTTAEEDAAIQVRGYVPEEEQNPRPQSEGVAVNTRTTQYICKVPKPLKSLKRC